MSGLKERRKYEKELLKTGQNLKIESKGAYLYGNPNALEQLKQEAIDNITRKLKELGHEE